MNSDRPHPADHRAEADASLCELMMYGVGEMDVTVERLAEEMAKLLSQGAAFGPRSIHAPPRAFDALSSANPLMLEAIALNGFDWSGARDAEGGAALNVFFQRRLSAADPQGSVIHDPSQPSMTLRARHDLIAARGSEALMRLGCDPNLASSKTMLGCSKRASWTPLHCAAMANEPMGLESLIAGGADVQPRDSEGMDALEIAISHGSPRFVERWVAMGLPLPSSDRIREIVSRWNPASDREGVSMCARMLSAILLAHELGDAIIDPPRRGGLKTL